MIIIKTLSRTINTDKWTHGDDDDDDDDDNNNNNNK